MRAGRLRRAAPIHGSGLDRGRVMVASHSSFGEVLDRGRVMVASHSSFGEVVGSIG